MNKENFMEKKTSSEVEEVEVLLELKHTNPSGGVKTLHNGLPDLGFPTKPH